MRFFLHVHDDIIATDEEGADLPDAEAAKEYARAAARELICDQARAGLVNLDHRIEIETESHAHVATIWFREAVQFQP